MSKEHNQEKVLAERYGRLAKANQGQFEIFREEVEAAFQEELTLQTEQGCTLRSAASLAILLTPLVAGSALGAYSKDITLARRVFLTICSTAANLVRRISKSSAL
ncbi:hypothetical protein ACYZT7_10355 [Pseudomonas sp. RT4P38]